MHPLLLHVERMASEAEFLDGHHQGVCLAIVAAITHLCRIGAMPPDQDLCFLAGRFFPFLTSELGRLLFSRVRHAVKKGTEDPVAGR